jgi:hypothetical protein
MKRIMIQADPQLLERAKRVAHERGVSVAQVVRDALEKEVGAPQRKRPSFVGAFSSGGGKPSARELTERGAVPPVSWR